MTKPKRLERFAKYELQTALLDGIFESSKKVSTNKEQRRIIERKFDHVERDKHGKVVGEKVKDAIALRLKVPYSLGTAAESLLLAILKIAGQEGDSSLPNDLLLTTENALNKNVQTAEMTMFQLLREAGMGDSTKAYTQARGYLQQMSEISVWYSNNVTGWSGSSWFMAHEVHKDGRLRVQMNWRLSGAIFGEYLSAHIDLDERAELTKDPSKSLHRWLSAHIWAGNGGKFHYHTLIRHIWSAEASEATQRKRISRLKKEILPEIGSLDCWEISQSESFVQIFRKPGT
jgi:hypothetical protein